MPVCSPALLLTAAATLTTVAGTRLPTPTDLVTPTWCYATRGGQNVESWSLKPDGSAQVILHVKDGAKVHRVFNDASWRLKKDKLVVRVPRHQRRVLTIESYEGRRLTFENEKQAVPCQPR